MDDPNNDNVTYSCVNLYFMCQVFYSSYEKISSFDIFDALKHFYFKLEPYLCFFVLKLTAW